ncbi:MAG TPA: PP2C family protein-serine/threonine phosphatase [Phycisphaerae bacterium]|nr:PP2C family protein-serine/threonine phosphatase [Phycisphaerae bacterium]
MAQPNIHVLLDEPVVPPAIAAALRQVDAGIRLSRLETELTSPSRAPADARLIITNAPAEGRADRLRTLYQHCDRHPCATLVVTPTPVSSGDRVTPAGGSPIGFASGLSAAELAGRLAAMCSFREPLSRLRDEVAELRERDRIRGDSASHFDTQLQLASQMQRDLLPHPLPQVRGARLHTLYRPADHVSGDIYDVLRLDDSHVGLSIADATGHGMPGALLTMFIKRTMRGKETYGGASHLLSACEVLEVLNRELLEAHLTQCHFVTALYATFSEDTRRVCWARGGAPYPILIRPGLPAQQLRSDGTLLGVLEEPQFERVELTLEPGDVMVFHTDGLDALLLDRTRPGRYDDITETPWFKSLRCGSIADHLAQIRDRLEETSPSGWPVDDLTIVALEVV